MWFSKCLLLQVLFQAEEPPGGRKQYNTRGGEKQVRDSGSGDGDGGHVSEEDGDFQQKPPWKKTPTTKANTDSFYGGVYRQHRIRHFAVVYC